MPLKRNIEEFLHRDKGSAIMAGILLVIMIYGFLGILGVLKL